MPQPQLEIHYDSEDTGGSGEWAALYVDGRLVTVGDSYLAEEKAFSLLGVRRVQDSAFMCGQDQRAGVAPTLEDVAAYAADRDRRLARARELHEQAARLREQALELERTARAAAAR